VGKQGVFGYQQCAFSCGRIPLPAIFFSLKNSWQSGERGGKQSLLGYLHPLFLYPQYTGMWEGERKKQTFGVTNHPKGLSRTEKLAVPV
jgi:hypothetical protein